MTKRLKCMLFVTGFFCGSAVLSASDFSAYDVVSADDVGPQEESLTWEEREEFCFIVSEIKSGPEIKRQLAEKIKETLEKKINELPEKANFPRRACSLFVSMYWFNFVVLEAISSALPWKDVGASVGQADDSVSFRAACRALSLAARRNAWAVSHQVKELVKPFSKKLQSAVKHAMKDVVSQSQLNEERIYQCAEEKTFAYFLEDNNFDEFFNVVSVAALKKIRANKGSIPLEITLSSLDGWDSFSKTYFGKLNEEARVYLAPWLDALNELTKKNEIKTS